jgi:hypothetical protein
MNVNKNEKEMVQVGSQMMTPEEVEQLIEKNASEGVKTEIYKWEFPDKKVVEGPVSMDKVKKLLTKLFSKVQSLAYKNKNFSNEDLKNYVLKDPEMEKFSKTHPRLFTMVCKRQTSTSMQHLHHIMNLIQIRELQESEGSVEDHTKQISNYFMNNFLKPPDKKSVKK